MTALRIHGFGGPEVLRRDELPVPEVGQGELVVRVRAAGVNPVDWKIREGMLKELHAHKLPHTLGWDASGTVAATGAGVAGFAVGDAVLVHSDIARDGAYAEYLAVAAESVARKPASLDFVHAAGLPLAGLTAWQALFDLADLRAGQRVLIHAAAGGVGGFAVQLAKWKGAFVYATASARNEAYVRQLGADAFIDYGTARFEDVARDVDVVLDTIDGETQERSWSVLKPGGFLVAAVQPLAPGVAEAHGCRGTFVHVAPNGEQLAELADLARGNRLRVRVDAVFPLERASSAHERSRQGHTRGKLVLRVGD